MNNDNDDAVARLLRMAGRRPAVETERMDRVRENVRAEWERNLRRRRRVRVAVIGAALAATLAGVLLLRPSFTPAPANGVTLVARAIETSPDEFRSLDWNGATLRLDRNTRVILEERGVATLERGALYYSSDGNPGEVMIRTPLGDIQDIGTQFEVRLASDAVRVRVREGVVALRGTTAEAGTELTASRMEIVRRPVAVSGEEWAWIERAAPPITLEGQKLAAVLERIAHEKGLRVRWNGTPRDAILHGSVPLNIDEALDAATGAAGVSYRIAGGELQVTP